MRFVKGHKPSQETLRKLSELRKGRVPWNKGLNGYSKDYPRTDEWKSRISEGKKNSSTSTLASKRSAMKMHEGNIGRKPTEETRAKMSESQKRIGNRPPVKCGSECHLWRGGISYEPYTGGWNQTLKGSIRERDQYVCVECGSHQSELPRKLDIHHIDYDKKNCDPKNLVSLCQTCHAKTNTDRGRWRDHFAGLVYAQ